MKKINNLAELRTERNRLRQKRLRLESEIEQNYLALKESLSPSNLITEGAAKMLVNKNHGIVNEVVSLLSDLLLKKVIFKNAGFITKLIVPFIARNTANNFLQDNKTKVLGWVADLILKLGKRKNQLHDTSTVGTEH